MTKNESPRITGLGGVFYVASDPAATREWYRDILGVDGPYGPQFDWGAEPRSHPYSLISHFADDEYIQPGSGGFMINLRVNDLDGFMAQLEKKDVPILGSADEGYGKFAWILDPDGIKIELWEQVADEPA